MRSTYADAVPYEFPKRDGKFVEFLTHFKDGHKCLAEILVLKKAERTWPVVRGEAIDGRAHTELMDVYNLCHGYGWIAPVPWWPRLPGWGISLQDVAELTPLGREVLGLPRQVPVTAPTDDEQQLAEEFRDRRTRKPTPEAIPMRSARVRSKKSRNATRGAAGQRGGPSSKSLFE